ncbi:hypothetical protein [Dyadobacter psychrotolerans]|uniref:Lipocalin-like domain-containing protein n=1 Tax=Dyadobacter psychrotolerans TaxID=2541721 RepID=A0A4R5DTP3_9BACT|nr:hypothetical protein [Dyadobacter psychrotolerans]TDE17147.1 hypothetical protein E0F88_04395 [Dyadobacter psychrotolerans]
MKLTFTLLFIFQGFIGLCQSNDSSAYASMTGKWILLSKVKIETSDGQPLNQEKEVYKPEEKSFEFTEKGEVIIAQDFGKHSEKLPVSLKGNYLYIGKFQKNKTPYLVRYEGEQMKLAKTETKNKKGKTIVKTEQVIMQKMPQ